MFRKIFQFSPKPLTEGFWFETPNNTLHKKCKLLKLLHLETPYNLP